jgi:indolepyruvate ferredoxin oxidoreductase alpha subunit
VEIGKNKLPLCGEINADLIDQALGKTASEPPRPVQGLPQRPPVFCPSCAHRGLFTILAKLKVFVSGDIGCYTLGALPPMNAMHSVIDMGASISAAHGMAKVNAIAGRDEKPVAVIGDSTFFHSGMTGLMSMAYNGGNALVVIMDNRTTGMTGGQENPGSGVTLQGIPARQVEIAPLVKALGIDHVEELNTYDLKATEAAIKKGLETPGPYVLIDRNPCVLRYKIRKPPITVDQDKCTGCRACLKVACMALGLTASGEKQKVRVDPNICNGCGICKQMCKFDAMHELKGADNANI